MFQGHGTGGDVDDRAGGAQCDHEVVVEVDTVHGAALTSCGAGTHGSATGRSYSSGSPLTSTEAAVREADASDRAVVLVVDDHPLIRRGLSSLLRQEAWVSRVFETATVADAVRLAVTEEADVVAMDLRLDEEDGVEGTRRLL